MSVFPRVRILALLFLFFCEIQDLFPSSDWQPQAAIAALAQPELPLAVGEVALRVVVGPGAAESSIRQIVRTLDGYVYIAAADDQGGPALGFPRPTHLRMYKSTTAGIPSGFREVSRARRPRTDRYATFSGGDMRLDRNGIIHVVYYRTSDGATVYQLFDTNTDQWDATATVVTTFGGRPGKASYGSRGRTINSVALDRENNPVVAVGGDNGVKIFRKTSDGWIEEVMLSTAPSVHPTMTFDRLNRLHVTWLEEYSLSSAVHYALREDGVWSDPEPVFAGDLPVSTNSNLAQSPSIAVDSQNRPVVLYLAGDPGHGLDVVQTRTLTAGLWIADDPPSAIAHAPGLHMRDDVKFVLLGDDREMQPGYMTHQPTEAEWSTVVNFRPGTPVYAYAGSASARYDPQYETDCSVVDVVYFDEVPDKRGGFKPVLYYAAIKLNGETSGDGSCRELLH
ncbi:MAG: hypothetical protein HYZ50_22515 [Deltaproteobacteria bacterium]|nr:hypothetical protein [Deltaproteobacteria bacterium]